MKYIYIITNLVNGKTYIGKRDCKEILPEDDTYMSSSYILWGIGKYTKQGAFAKYGKQNFKKEILIQGDFSTFEINELERYYIWLAKAEGKAQYNIASGGDGGKLVEEVWNKGRTWSKEVRNRISETNKKYCKEKHSQWGTHRSNETKKRISEAIQGKYKGVNSPHFGKKHSEEWCKHSSQALKGLNTGASNPKARKVICLNTNQIFDTLRQGAEWGVKSSSAGICNCAKGKAQWCGNHPQTNEKLKWSYYEDTKN